MKPFEIGPGLHCEIDRLVASRLLIQANSGGGKTRTIRRLLEQSHGRLQHLVIDPEGEYHTLRERFDYVLAAPSGGDTVAHPRTAALLAERLLQLNVSAILDIYELNPDHRTLFVQRFLDALVNAPRELWHPVLVVLDEAHVYAPEGKENASTAAVKAMASRGRKRGFCLVPATQRLAKLSKDVAAECNNKLIGRCTLDVDIKRAAEELGFTSNEQKASLRQLEPGQFFGYGPAFNVKAPVLVHVGAVVTTHPEPGAKAAPVPAPTDKVKKVLQQLADLPAEADDREKSIAELKRDNVEKTRRIKQLEAGAEKVSRTVSPEVPTKRDAARAGKITELQQNLARHRRALEEAVKILVKVKAVDFSARGGEALEQAVTQAVKQITAGIEKRVTALAERVQGIQSAATAAEASIAKLLDEKVELTVTVAKQAPFTVTPSPAQARVTGSSNSHVSEGLTLAKQRILNGLAFLRGIGLAQADKTQLALIVGVSPTSGAYFNNLGALRTAGLLDYPSGGTVALTAAGQNVASAEGVPSTTEELHAAIRAKLPPAKWKIVEALIGAYPKSVAKDQLAEQIGVSPTSGAYFNNLGSLRSLGLIDYPRSSEAVAKPVLFLES